VTNTKHCVITRPHFLVVKKIHMTKTGTPSTSMQSPNISDSLKQSPDWKATNYSFSGLYNNAIYIIHFVIV